MMVLPRRPEMPWYRTEMTRWALIITGAALAWSFSPWGPHKWRDTPSLRLLHHVMPWPVCSLLLAIYTVLLIYGRVKAVIAADFLGLYLYGAEFVAMLLRLNPHAPTNPFAIGGVFLACVLHIAAGRLAVYEGHGV